LITNKITIFFGIPIVNNILINSEGYLRLASEPYDITSVSLKNKFIHLTNNAV